MFLLKMILALKIALTGFAYENICQKYLENLQVFTKLKDAQFLDYESIPVAYKERGLPIHFGLKQEYQKQASETCLGLKLWKYSDSSYNDPVEQFKFFGQTNNIWIFLLNEQNSTQEGYYSFTYQQESSKQTYHFKLKIMINFKNNEVMLIQEENQIRLLESTTTTTNTNIESQLNICNNQSCTSTNNQLEIYLNDPFYMISSITDPNYNNYYLTNTTVYFVGDGLYQIKQIQAIDNSIKGQVKISMIADIAWSFIQMQVYSKLSTDINGSNISYTTLSTINTTLLPLSQFENVGCSASHQCSVTAQSKLKICSDRLCTVELDLKNIRLNDTIFIQQSITTIGLQSYYLTDTILFYVGENFRKQILPLQVNSTEKGKVIIMIKVKILLQNVSISVLSYLSTTPESDPIGFPINFNLIEKAIKTEKIECVKANADSKHCPTCKEYCSINGFDEDSCKNCVENNINILRSLLIILLIIFY